MGKIRNSNEGFKRNPFNAIALPLLILFLIVSASPIAYGIELVTKWGTDTTSDGHFNFFQGVAVDSLGNVYVADTDNSRIQKFNSSGTYATQWGSSGSANGQFSYPQGVAVNSVLGKVYVADSNNNRIQKFDSNGVWEFTWDIFSSSFSGPVGIAVDSSAAAFIYVADTYNYRIQKFNSSGTYAAQWGSYGTGNGQFRIPIDIAVSSSGYVYVADMYNDRIHRFDLNGNSNGGWGSHGSGDGQFYWPEGVAVDSSGNVYVVEYGNSRIQKFDSSGVFITKWGSLGSGDGQFDNPEGVAVDSSGNVYVADTDNHRIQKFRPFSTLTVTKAGTGQGTVSSSPSGISCGSTCSALYNDGTQVTLTALADAGSTFSGWSGACTGTGTCVLTLYSPQNVTATFKASTTTTVTSNNNPSTYGQSVTFTATVSPSAATGTVRFWDGGVPLGTGILSGGQATSPAISNLATGTHYSITAGYEGDSNYNPSTSPPFTQTVNKATPTITWANPANITYGTPLSGIQLRVCGKITSQIAGDRV